MFSLVFFEFLYFLLLYACFDSSDDGEFVKAVAFWLGGNKIVCFGKDNDVMWEFSVAENSNDMSVW